MEWSDKRARWELAAFGQEIRQIEPGDVIVCRRKSRPSHGCARSGHHPDPHEHGRYGGNHHQTVVRKIYQDTDTFSDFVLANPPYRRVGPLCRRRQHLRDQSGRQRPQAFPGLHGMERFQGALEIASFGQKIQQIEPGDVIVVPEKISQIAWLREIRDITQILMNVAVTAGVVIKLF
jgi:hypothetical protein